MRVRPKIEIKCTKLGDEFMEYKLTISLDGKDIVSRDNVWSEPGFTGEYDYPGEVHDRVLHDVIGELITEAGQLAEIHKVYMVASSPAAAEWGWKDYLKGGTKIIVSDDLEFIQTEAKYESLRYRQRKGESTTDPDHYTAYTITTAIEQVKETNANG